MSRAIRIFAITVALALAFGCGHRAESLGPAETFHWVSQPIAFAPPTDPWRREGDNGGGILGVRFVLTGGGGQCLSVGAYRLLADRDVRGKLERLYARRDSLSEHEFLQELSLARPRTEDPLSDREAAATAEINDALNRAVEDYMTHQSGFVTSDLESAVRAASAYEPTLEEILPRIRLYPERMQEPEQWRLGVERDTTIAGQPAFASDDTLITPDRPLLYHQIFWVVKGCAFQAVYQGTPQNLPTFEKVVDSIQFPEGAVAVSN